MKKIDDRFIQEAIRIRKEYLSSIFQAKSKESELVSIKNDINDTYSKIAESENEIDEELMKDKIDKLRRKVDDITKYINPIINNIESLKNDADILYENIKDKYPNVTKEELMSVFLPYMRDIDSEFNL